MSSEVVHSSDERYLNDLNDTRVELVTFLHENFVSPKSIFYTTERVCLPYLSGYSDICASATKNPTSLFPTLEIFKEGFRNMVTEGYNPDVATVLLSDPSVAVVKGFGENASPVAKNDAAKVLSDYKRIVDSGRKELAAAYVVKKFATGTPNKTEDIIEILSNTPRKIGTSLGDLL